MVLYYMEVTSELIYLYQVTEQILDERLGRTVTRVVLPRVVMHSRYHYGVSASFYSFRFVCVGKGMRLGSILP